MTGVRRSALVWLPSAVGVIAWKLHIKLEPQQLLPAVALTFAALMGLSTMTFTRLKDAAGAAKPEVGIDPATSAYYLFRRVNRTAVEALLIGGLCVVSMAAGDRWEWLASALLLAGITYVGTRLLAVLWNLRQQAEHLIGDRYVPVGKQQRPDIKIAR